jgi:hypothetical protein
VLSCFPGRQLLQKSLAAIEEDEAVKVAQLHVHTANTDAVEWYTKQGFKVSAFWVPTWGHCCKGVVLGEHLVLCSVSWFGSKGCPFWLVVYLVIWFGRWVASMLCSVFKMPLH